MSGEDKPMVAECTYDVVSGQWVPNDPARGTSVRRAATEADGAMDLNPVGAFSTQTVQAAVLGISTLLISFGVKWVVDDAQVDKIANGVAAIVSMISFAWAAYGRVQAERIVDSRFNPKIKLLRGLMRGVGRRFPALVCAGALAVTSIGCTAGGRSPMVELHATRQAVLAAEEALYPLIVSDRFDPATLRAIQAVRGEVYAGLDAAKQAAMSGNAIGYKFYMERLDAALTRWLELQGKVRPARPTTRAIGANESWTRQRLSDSSCQVRRWWRYWGICYAT